MHEPTSSMMSMEKCLALLYPAQHSEKAGTKTT